MDNKIYCERPCINQDCELNKYHIPMHKKIVALFESIYVEKNGSFKIDGNTVDFAYDLYTSEKIFNTTDFSFTYYDFSSQRIAICESELSNARDAIRDKDRL